MSDRYRVVREYAQIDGAPDISDRDKQRVATLLTEQSWDYIVWIPEWVLEDDDKDVETVESSDHLAVGRLEDYSEKAWRLWQSHRNSATSEPNAFLPKSAVVVFERATGVETVDSPQAGLTEWSA